MSYLDHNRVQVRHGGRDQRRQRQQRQLHGEKGLTDPIGTAECRYSE
jgi:hypothetical protein